MGKLRHGEGNKCPGGTEGKPCFITPWVFKLWVGAEPWVRNPFSQLRGRVNVLKPACRIGESGEMGPESTSSLSSFLLLYRGWYTLPSQGH